LLLILCGSGCATHQERGSDPVATEQALTVIDCQTQAAECLGTSPTAELIDACRTEVQACLSDVVGEAQATASAVGECAQASAECASNATTAEEAAACRADFEACVGDVVELPDPPPPPDLPDPGPALEAANACRQTAVDCASEAASAEDIAACGEAFRACIAELVPEIDLPDPPPRPDLGPLLACRDEARACIEGAQGADDVSVCRDAFASCVAELAPDLPDPTVVRECVAGLRDCIGAGTSPAECAAQARECAGL